MRTCRSITSALTHTRLARHSGKQAIVAAVATTLPGGEVNNGVMIMPGFPGRNMLTGGKIVCGESEATGKSNLFPSVWRSIPVPQWEGAVWGVALLGEA